ncbi:MAG: hypothetical protein ACKO0N_05835, partial [Planctomycetota bacterium]
LFWAAVLFLLDVFVRRVAIRLAPFWSWLMTRLGFGRQEPALAGPSLDRLRSRKAEVARELNERRTTSRFEAAPPPGSDASGKEMLDAVLESEIAKEREVPPPKPVTNIDQPAESHTARLLELKRKAKKDRPSE